MKHNQTQAIEDQHQNTCDRQQHSCEDPDGNIKIPVIGVISFWCVFW